MAALSDDSRRAVWADLMRQALGPVAALKGQLRACVDAADAWVDASVAAFVATLPTGEWGAVAKHTLLANAAAIGRGAEIADVAAGIASRSQSQGLLAAYNAASAWLGANVAGYVAALGADGVPLTTGQQLAVLEAVCRRRATDGIG